RPAKLAAATHAAGAHRSAVEDDQVRLVLGDPAQSRVSGMVDADLIAGLTKRGVQRVVARALSFYQQNEDLTQRIYSARKFFNIGHGHYRWIAPARNSSLVPAW